MRVADLKVGALLYYTGSDHLYAMLVDEIRSERLYSLASWAEIYPRLDKFLEALEGSYPTRLRRRLFHEFCHEWGPRLLPPFSDLQEYDVLVLIPHFELHALPLHTIWVESAGNYLGLARAVTYCSSATLFRHCVAGNADRLDDLANWTFYPETGRHHHAPPAPEVCCAYGVDLLTGKNDQYRALAELFTQSFKQGQLLANILPRPQIKRPDWEAICVVCHGYFDPANPRFSGLLLDREPSAYAQFPVMLHRDMVYIVPDLPFQDVSIQVQLEPSMMGDLLPRVQSSKVAELMTVAELQVQLNTSAELVALFGCSTGSGHMLSGDDFNSLAYQWLKLGAASVLASLWELDFGFISECLPIFLENWIKYRQPKAFAMRQALRAMLQNHPDSEPYEWGVLVMLGDWL